MMKRTNASRFTAMLAAIAAVGLPSLAQTPIQNVEFLRGCWVSKDGGKITGFLRLLPGAPDGPAYSGMITPASGDPPSTPMSLSFARDGSNLALEHPFISGDLPAGRIAVTIPPTTKSRVSFAEPVGDGPRRWVVAEGDGDTLTIFIITAKSPLIGTPDGEIFSGERDGCD